MYSAKSVHNALTVPAPRSLNVRSYMTEGWSSWVTIQDKKRFIISQTFNDRQGKSKQIKHRKTNHSIK